MRDASLKKEYPHTSRFVQPDYWNFKNTYLPAEIQHELMRYTGLNASQLLVNPLQQLAFGFVQGNPLLFVDPFGLYALMTTENLVYKQIDLSEHKKVSRRALED